LGERRAAFPRAAEGGAAMLARNSALILDVMSVCLLPIT
jgi:hypothetical protein